MTSPIGRREVLTGITGAALAAASVAGAKSPASGLDISRLVRTALFVRDIDVATSFYRDLLGLDQLFYSGKFTGPIVGQLLGIPAGATTIARILKVEGLPFGMIGLFQVLGGNISRVQKQRGSVNIGESVLVFYMPALDPLVDRLNASHWQILCRPTSLVPGSREMSFYGPDDVLINVIERNHRAII